MSYDILILPALQDNYIYFLENKQHKLSAVVDPGDIGPVVKMMTEKNLTKLDLILLTHHHIDHTAGAYKLRELYGAKIIAPQGNLAQLPHCDRYVREGDTISFGETHFLVIESPGHTLGHILLYDAQKQVLFVGDTLFCAGCGRLMEGTMEQMYKSLAKIKALPENTKIYCAHEYTQRNLEFSRKLLPNTAEIEARYQVTLALRAKNKPTVPSLLSIELQTNPFLMAEDFDEFTKYRLERNKY